jgi:Uma2 family endonuclease
MVKAATELRLSPYLAGRRMTPEEFDEADFEEGWRYELIEGILVVSPIPKMPSRGMGSKLVQRLENYCEQRGKGIEFLTVFQEHEVRIANGARRRCDVAVWVRLGRNPRRSDVPTITAEFVSERATDIRRDYVDKRADYLTAGVQEYWIIDRFRRILTALRRRGRRWEEHVVEEGKVYTTPLLPGFKLDVAELLARADALAEEN